MKKILPILFLLIASLVHGQSTKILFIGNSYVATNNLPQVFYNLALSLGDTLYYDSNSPGGYTFQMHSNDATTLAKINAQDWDYVILQAQSQEPSFPPAQVASDTYPYAAILDSLVHVNNECTKTMFYMTWGRKYGDAANCAFYPPVCTFEGMNQRLRESYLEMGANNFAQVAPVGIAWKNSRMIDSTINLWSGDNSHPSIAGTYLTACVFYASIFRQSPLGASYNAGLTTQQANFLQQVATSTVLDSLNTWMLEQDPIHANFSYTSVSTDVTFNSGCYNATQYHWDFGDGNISNLANPQHTFPAQGNYTVQLIASNNCYSDTIILPVQVPGTSGIEDISPAGIVVYPNPVQQDLIIESKDITGVMVTDLQGKILINEMIGEKTNSYKLSFAQFTKGTYILRVHTLNGSTYQKILKE